MIENPEPIDWRALQAGVCRIFNEIGLQAEQDKDIETPRGKISLDVYAIDPGSVDKIQYVVECKNWKTAVPQSVVHSFTTVIQEVGANIGYIVSKRGMQAGASSYTKNTNIKGLTFSDFQHRYFDIWIKKFFIPKIGIASDSLCNYTEPINSHRFKKVEQLSSANKKLYSRLDNKYCMFGQAICLLFPKHIDFAERAGFLKTDQIKNISTLNNIFALTLNKPFQFKSVYYSDLLSEIIDLVEAITSEFNNIFGENIFARHQP